MARERARTRLICPLTASSPETMRRQMAEAVRLGADTIECRLDYLSTPPTVEQLEQLLRGAGVAVIATCRPAWEGGAYEGAEYDRLTLLHRSASHGAAFLDIELAVEEDNRPHATKLILSHHDFDRCPEHLGHIVSALETSDGDVNKVAFRADGPEDALQAFDVIRACDKPTIALAMGEAGVLSRILAPKFGAFGTFGALEAGAESAPGQPTLEDLRTVYRWESLGPRTQVFGVIGCPVTHSMSPAIHNASFEATGYDGVYVPVLIRPGEENFRRFMDALRRRPWMDWGGLSVTIPHKENALAYVGETNCDELAVQIGAVNTITFQPDGSLRGDNTDYAAALDALCEAMGIERTALAGRSLAVLGAGGAARAVVAGLVHYGADVTIYNRTLRRGEALADEFGARAQKLDAAGRSDAEILINCTPIGMHSGRSGSPLERIPPGARVVFDTIYNPPETELLRRAREAGCETVSGVEMFVHQGAAQFERWTKRNAPHDVMRTVVLDRLG